MHDDASMSVGESFAGGSSGWIDELGVPCLEYIKTHQVEAFVQGRSQVAEASIVYGCMVASSCFVYGVFPPIQRLWVVDYCKHCE